MSYICVIHMIAMSLSHADSVCCDFHCVCVCSEPGSGGSSTRSVRKHVATLNTGKSTRQGKQSRHLRKQTPFSSTLGFRRLNDNRTSVLSLEKAGPDLKKVTESAEDSSEDDGSDLEECAESCDNSAWPSAPVVAGDSSSLRANLPSLGIAAINASTNSKLSGRKHRYIAFVGNLPFHATSEEVISHFRKRGVVIRELRLLTDKTTGCSKGCCFAEFCDAKTLQVCPYLVMGL